MKILMVLTSHDQLGNTGKKTGFWLEEFASPYYQFIDNGAQVTLSSPKGGQPPIDPKSSSEDSQTEMTKRFNKDAKTQKALSQTTKLSDIDFNEFDGVFYPGGHGPMWDLKEDRDSIRLIENFFNAGKPVAAVCHAPSVLLNVKIDGQYIVKGKEVSGFTNSEEEASGLTKVVPFLLEDELKKLGGKYKKVGDWKSLSVADGLLITGQNPASSEAVAKKFMEMIDEKKSPAVRNRDSSGIQQSMNP